MGNHKNDNGTPAHPTRPTSIATSQWRDLGGSKTLGAGTWMVLFTWLLTIGCADGNESVVGPSEDGNPSIPVSYVEVSPDGLTLEKGSTDEITLKVLGSDGTPLERDGSWEVEDSAVVELTGSGTTRTIRGLEEGSTLITAKVGKFSDGARIEVHGNSQKTEEVHLSPSLIELETGAVSDIALEVTDASGATLDRSGQWSVGDETVVRLTGDGSARQVEALTAGSTVVIAKVGSVADTAAVEVWATESEGLAVGSVTVSPENSTVEVDAAVQLSATVTDSSGTELDRTVSWSSSNASVATVSADGMVTGRAEGTVGIVTSVDGVADTAAVEVTAVPDPDEVTDLTVATTTETSVQLEWTEVDDGTGELAKYALRYASPSMDSWDEAYPTEETVEGDGIGTSVVHEFTALDPGTDYEFQLVAYRGTLDVDATFGSLSNVASATTDAESDTTSSSSITKLGGDGQTDTVGETLADPLVVQVIDENGAGVSGVAVTWSVLSGGGSVSANSSSTDENGQAQVDWTLGGTVGTQEVQAEIGSGDAVTFSATAEAGSVTSVQVTPSIAELEEGNSVQLAATLEDNYGNEVEGSVSWLSSDLSAADVDESGLVQAKEAGEATITATVDGIEGSSSVTVTKDSTADGLVFGDGFESGGLSHTENGYAWGVGTGEGVTQGVGRGGGFGLEFTYPASADGDDSKPNLNLLFGTQPTEVWVEYWMKVPSNFNHRDQSTGATNNKFFQIWGGGTRTAEPKAILEYQRVDPVGSGDRAESFIRDGENGGALSSEVGDAANNPFIASSDHGNWIQVRWHFKIGDHGSSNSVLEMWKNGSLWHSDTAHDDLTSSDSSKNYFDHIRLFGWSNSGFDEETTFIIDDFRIHTSDPGW